MIAVVHEYKSTIPDVRLEPRSCPPEPLEPALATAGSGATTVFEGGCLIDDATSGTPQLVACPPVLRSSV